MSETVTKIPTILRGRTIRALIFDFDGLILDTETADYQAWKEAYASYGCDLPLLKWAEGIGSMDTFDPYDYLRELLGGPVDKEALRARRRSRFGDIMAERGPLPGVLDYLTDARRLGLKVGIASSSPRSWVAGFLDQMGLTDRFDGMATGDQVERTKPDPAVYVMALDALGVQAADAIALEDSPNGVAAAGGAGIYCVAVPNAMTRGLPFGSPDLTLGSLADMSLVELIALAEGVPRRRCPAIIK